MNIIGDDFAAPYTWKANLAYRKFITPIVYAGINAYYARTLNNFICTDVNRKAQPEFTLSKKANRPVFSPRPTTNAATSPIILVSAFSTATFNTVAAQRFLIRDAAVVNQNPWGGCWN